MNLKAYGHNRLTLVLVQGLQFLHGSRHLVHRDIKPANLLVNLDGEPKITDFGISAGLDNSIAMVRRLHIWIGLIFLCAESKTESLLVIPHFEYYTSCSVLPLLAQ